MLIWRGDTGDVIGLLLTGNTFYFWEDMYAGLPDNPVTEPTPAGRIKPINGFGRVWGNFPDVRESLGWAIEEEVGYTLNLTRYTHPHPHGSVTDLIFNLPDGSRIAFMSDGTWRYLENTTTPDNENCICSLPHQTVMPAAYQAFENGFMLYWFETGSIWVMTNDGQAVHYPTESYGTLPNDPAPLSTIPPAGRYVPILGFGKVWGYYEAARDQLGWALGAETGYDTSFVRTVGANGVAFVVTLPDGAPIIITDDGFWSAG